MADSDREVAQRTQEKFQFYVVGLTFTVLALSIQTASFDGHVVSRMFEVLAWLGLFSSGLLGLSRIEWEPVLRVRMSIKDELEESLTNFQKQQQQGVQRVFVTQSQQEVPIEERIAHYQNLIEQVSPVIEGLDKKAELKYKCFKITFVCGIGTLLLARAIDPLIGIFSILLG